MFFPPLRGDIPRDLASELSHIQADKHGKIFYTTYINEDLTSYEIQPACISKGD